jgi:hypothetical protein
MKDRPGLRPSGEKEVDIMYYKRLIFLCCSSIMATCIIGCSACKKDIQRPNAAIDNINYSEIELQKVSNGFSKYICDEPYFSLLLSNGTKVTMLYNTSQSKLIICENEGTRIEIRIIDVYGLTNNHETPREKYSYNDYSDMSIKYAYRTYIKTLEKENKEINIRILESDIRKLNGNILLYVKMEAVSDNGIPVYRIIYDFMSNGFSFDFVGMYTKEKPENEVYKSLNSIKFEKSE